ncbi:MAG: hypothetical protein ACRDBH_10700 [Bosea sp. (in: a-proteobacteria)]
MKYELGQTALIDGTEKSGKIIGRSEYLYSEANYLLRYNDHNGEQVERWHSESAIASAT